VPFDLIRLFGQIQLAALDAIRQQAGLVASEIGIQGLAAALPRRHLLFQPLIPLAIGDQRPEQANLMLGLLHGLMCSVEIVELAANGFDPLLNWRLLQHVSAHKIGEVADRFHGHSLIEQIQCLLGLDAHAPPELPGVLTETVE
jgi:hypothetical protein